MSIHIRASRHAVIKLAALLAAAASLGAVHAPPSTVAPDLCHAARATGEDRLTRICGQIRHLGHGTYNTLGLIPQSWNVLLAIAEGTEGREEFAQPRHFFAYDAFVFTVRSDSAHHLDMVLRGAAAVESMKSGMPRAYELLTTMNVFTTAPALPNAPARGRFKTTFISFDRTPDDIAAGVTLNGTYTDSHGERVYDNYAIISVDEVTIRGAVADKGSRPIYGLASAQDNYRAYMADGLLYSLAHEGVHRYIDYLSTTHRQAEMMYRARNVGTPAIGARAQASKLAEEIVANETAMALVGSQVSGEMRDHVRKLNNDFVTGDCVRAQLAHWRAVVGASRSALIIPE